VTHIAYPSSAESINRISVHAGLGINVMQKANRAWGVIQPLTPPKKKLKTNLGWWSGSSG
jgi:hypothetical protein